MKASQKIARVIRLAHAVLVIDVTFAVTSVGAGDAPDYLRDVVPLLTKYCAGCHNADEANGDLSMETHAALARGGENGPVIVAGRGDKSRLIQVLTGQAEPTMPPEDEPRPTSAEIELLKVWIDAGAEGPRPNQTPHELNVPQIESRVDGSKPVTSLAFSPDGRNLAVARPFFCDKSTCGDKDKFSVL